MPKKRIFIKIICLSLIFIMLFTSFVFAQSITKDETVYVNLNHNGEVEDITVSDWLYSDQTDVEIHDKSVLTDIKNVKGEEKPNIKGDLLTWKTDKGEIYYQGKAKKDLPLSVEISYSLDGKKIDPELLAGKSGEFEMIINIKNNESHDVMINGKLKKLYTPFAVVTIINFPSDKCRNIKVNTGKVLNDGNKTIITYATIPGLKDSLEIDSEDFDDVIELPKTLEIKANVEDFEIGDILITAESDSSILDDLKRSDNLIDETIDGVNDLTDASDDVKSGIETLDDGTKILLDNFTDFKGGVYFLKDATAMLDENVNGKILDGTKELIEGTDEFAQKLIELKDGTEKLLDGSKDLAKYTEEASFGVSEIKSGSRELVGGIDAFKGQISQGLEAAMKSTALEDEMTDAVENAIKSTIGSADLSSFGPEEQKQIAYLMSLSGGAAGQAAGKVAKNTVGTQMQGLATQLNGGFDQLSSGAKKLNSGLGSLKDGMKDLSEGANDLEDGMEELDDNVGLFVDGADILIDGAQTLSDGLEVLGEGTSSLKDGVVGLAQATDAVNDGISTLKVGTESLNDGYDEFDKDGVTELHNKVVDKTDDYDEIFEIKTKLAKLSNNYNNFSGISENTEGKVKFVMKIDSIQIEEIEEEKEIVIEEETGFINWLKTTWNHIFNKE